MKTTLLLILLALPLAGCVTADVAEDGGDHLVFVTHLYNDGVRERTDAEAARICAARGQVSTPLGMHETGPFFAPTRWLEYECRRTP